MQEPHMLNVYLKVNSSLSISKNILSPLIMGSNKVHVVHETDRREFYVMHMF